jgi:glutamate synthase (NADPH) small chain
MGGNVKQNSPKGFMEATRELPKKRRVDERVRDYKEIYLPMPEEKRREQAGRCMNCGVPFCHTGCPLGNLIPDWNDLVYQRQLEGGAPTNCTPPTISRVHRTPLPRALRGGLRAGHQRTGGHHRGNRKGDHRKGLFRRLGEGPEPPAARTGKKVAVIGSGPAGLACAQQLNRAGHTGHRFGAGRPDRRAAALRHSPFQNGQMA